jgi:hypothetical protein
MYVLLKDGRKNDPMLCVEGLKIGGIILNALSTIVLILLVFIASVQ